MQNFFEKSLDVDKSLADSRKVPIEKYQYLFLYLLLGYELWNNSDVWEIFPGTKAIDPPRPIFEFQPLNDSRDDLIRPCFD